MTYNHNEVVEKLAYSLDTIYFNFPLGSIHMGVPAIADVLTYRPSFTRFEVNVYEVKVSRADFLQELRKEKYKKSFGYCHRFYFVFPKGMIEVSEIPKECGAMEYDGVTFNTIRNAKVRHDETPRELLLQMIIFRRKNLTNELRMKMLADLKFNGISYSLYYTLGDKIGFQIVEFIKSYEKLSKEFSKIKFKSFNWCENRQEICDMRKKGVKDESCDEMEAFSTKCEKRSIRYIPEEYFKVLLEKEKEIDRLG